MKLSTRSRYGVRLMMALAAAGQEKTLFLKEIAVREAISEKYLSLIVIPLRSAGLIKSTRGARGGYSLAKAPESISLCDIVEAVEGETCLVHCVKKPDHCNRSGTCTARSVWVELGKKIREAMLSVSLASLVAKRKETESINSL